MLGAGGIGGFALDAFAFHSCAVNTNGSSFDAEVSIITGELSFRPARGLLIMSSTFVSFSGAGQDDVKRRDVKRVFENAHPDVADVQSYLICTR